MIQVHQRQASQKPSFGQQISGAIGGGLQAASNLMSERENKQAAEQEYQQQNQFYSQLSGRNLSRDPAIRKLEIESALKGEQEGSKFSSKIAQNKSVIRDIEKRRDLPEGSLDAYVSDPKMAEQVTRPVKEPKKTQASQPIDPEQLNKIKEVRSRPGFNDLDEVEKYIEMTEAGVSRELAETESKLTGEKKKRQQAGFETSYKVQEDFINDTTSSYRAFETEVKPKLLQMRNIPDKDIIGPTSAVFLEALGIPLGALDDPSSELYNKVSLDLLKGLPETYGNRILKVEVDNFLKTIPSLMNSSEGRRMIASNMLKLGEMKEVYYNEMRREQKKLLDEKKEFPRDFQQRIFDQVKPQIDRINEEFIKLSEIKSVPEATVPFFDPNGNINFVPKEHVGWAKENGGRQIW